MSSFVDGSHGLIGPTIQIVTEYNKLIGQVKNPNWQEAISLSSQYEWYYLFGCFVFVFFSLQWLQHTAAAFYMATASHHPREYP